MQQLPTLVTGCLLAIGATGCLDTMTGKISGDRPDGSAAIDAASSGSDATTPTGQPDTGAVSDSGPATTTPPPDSGSQADTRPQPDTTPPPDTANPPDDGTGPPPVLLPPGGPWLRDFIGDCIETHETLSWTADGAATWTFFDNNACEGPQPEVTFSGRAAAPEPHVLTLEFGDGGWPPTSSTWTWTIVPPGPAGSANVVPPGPRLVTSAFRRVGDIRWERTDRELRGQGNMRSDRRLDVAVTLRGYPEVHEMVVDFEVVQRFGGNDRRGGSGTLVFHAKRVITASGRAVIAAEGYDPNEYPDHYRFQQMLLERYDGHTVDLIAAAFFPVLYESGEDSALYIEAYDRMWSSATP